MSVTFPRLLGGFAVVWGLRNLWHGARAFPEASDALTVLLLGVLWLVAAAALLTRQRPELAALLIVLLALLEFVHKAFFGPYGLALLFWMGLIVAATHGRPDDRALLLRVCVTVVYAATGLAKLNPAWLAGDNLMLLAATRAQMAPLHDLLAGPAGVAMAFGVVALELWLAIGLWFARTRVPTAVVGVALHLGLMVSAIHTVEALANLTVLNLGLVAMYTAFWHRRSDQAVAEPSGEPAPA